MAGDTVPPTPDFVLAVPFGALIAVVGILSAVAERDRTGHGRFVDAGIVDAATWVIGEAVARVAEGQAAGWGQQASRRAYRTADGRLITLAAAEPRTWAALCDALDRPDLADRLFTPPDGQDALAAELAAVFAARPAAEWLSRLQDAGAMVGPVRDHRRAAHRRTRRRPAARSSNSTTAAAPGCCARPCTCATPTGPRPPSRRGPPPALGEHTDAALAAAGFSDDEIADLHEADVV